MIRSQKPLAIAKSSGFTLLEVMISLAILAGVIVSIIPLFAGGLFRSSLLDSQANALILAQGKMDELVLAQTLDDFEMQGKFSGGGYRFVITAEPYPVEDVEADYELLDVVLSVYDAEIAEANDENHLVQLHYLKGVAK